MKKRKEGMGMGDKDWQEANSLAGLFQKIVEDCKASLPLYEEFLIKSRELSSQLQSTATVFSSFIDTAQRLADSANNTKGSSTDLGIWLTRIVLRHRALEDHIKTVARYLSISCSNIIQENKEEWRKKVAKMDKEHSKQFKKARTLLKRKSYSIGKIDRKLKKKKNDLELINQRRIAALDFQTELRMLCEHERLSVREVMSHERSLYQVLATGLQPVIAAELAMFREGEQLGDLMENIDKNSSDPHHSEEDIKSVDFLSNSKESLWFTTPSSTPGGSLMGSRTSSLRSINSFSLTSSAASSDSEDQETCGPTQHSATLKKSSHSENVNKLQKRNSTISRQSQDSGFASQDFCLAGKQMVKQSYSTFLSPYHCAGVGTRQTQRPAVPVRSSSLGRSSDQQHSLPGREEQERKRWEPAYRRETFEDKETCYGDTETPTNETISILDGQFVYESSSASSSGYGSYQIADYAPDLTKTLQASDDDSISPELPPPPDDWGHEVWSGCGRTVTSHHWKQ